MNTEAIAQAAPAKRETDYPHEGVLLGNGWDSQLDRKTSVVAVDFTERKDEPPGQESWYRTREVLDRSSLMQALNVSAQASYEGWGVRVSAKAEFARSVKVDELSQSFIAHARVKNSAHFAAPLETSGAIDLKPEYAELAKRDLAEFRRQCGDCFVSNIEEGAELVAVLTFKVASRKEKQEIAASMEGSGWGFAASGEVENTMARYSEQQQLEIHYSQTGGHGAALPMNAQEFREQIQDLPSLAAHGAFPYKIGLTRYDTLPSWPEGVILPDLQPYRELLVQYNRYQSLVDVIDQILENPGDYLLGRGVNEASLKETQDELLRGLRAIGDVLGESIEHRDHPVPLPEAASKSEYAFRTRLPIPYAYDDRVSILTDSELLRQFISERWLEQTNRIRDKIDSASRVTNEVLKKYKQMIEIEGPFQTGDLIGLRADNGRYLSLSSFRGLQLIDAAKPDIDQFSRFAVTVFEDGRIALQVAFTGKYLSRVNELGGIEACRAFADQRAIDTYSRFTVTYLDEETIALHADTGRYLTLTSTSEKLVAPIAATKTTIDDLCKFSVHFL